MMNETSEPRNATEARRHRASTKKKTTAANVSARPVTAKRKATTRRVRAEDKRESTSEVDTDAVARNLDRDTGSRKLKGHATHALESTAPGKRPTRKSTRKGANGIKPDSQQHNRAVRKTRSAKSRHATTT